MCASGRGDRVRPRRVRGSRGRDPHRGRGAVVRLAFFFLVFIWNDGAGGIPPPCRFPRIPPDESPSRRDGVTVCLSARGLGYWVPSRSFDSRRREPCQISGVLVTSLRRDSRPRRRLHGVIIPRTAAAASVCHRPSGLFPVYSLSQLCRSKKLESLHIGLYEFSFV